MTPTKLITVSEVAKRLSVAESTVYAWVYERRIASVKLGRAVRIREAEVERLISKSERPVARSSLDC